MIGAGFDFRKDVRFFATSRSLSSCRNMTKDARKTQKSESSLLLLEKNLFWAQSDRFYFSVRVDTCDAISRGQKKIFA